MAARGLPHPLLGEEQQCSCDQGTAFDARRSGRSVVSVVVKSRGYQVGWFDRLSPRLLHVLKVDGNRFFCPLNYLKRAIVTDDQMPSRHIKTWLTVVMSLLTKTLLEDATLLG